MFLPKKVGMGRSLIRCNPDGNQRLQATVKDQYDSDKWEQPWWNRSTERSWKRNRKTQWKASCEAVKKFICLHTDWFWDGWIYIADYEELVELLDDPYGEVWNTQWEEETIERFYDWDFDWEFDWDCNWQKEGE